MSIEVFAKNRLGGGSNYEAALENAAALFAAQDTDALIRRTGCEADADYLYAELLQRRFRIRRADGKAELLAPDGAKPAGFDPAMALYDLFAYAEAGAKPAGTYVQIQNLSRVRNVRSFAGEGAFDRYARLFAGKSRALAQACAELGGLPFGKGDVSLAVPYFRDLRIGVTFWDADEEFPPALYVFQDENALAFMHYETLWYASGDLLEVLAEKAARWA